MTAHRVRIDVGIFGGGVAGLWLLARMRQLGYQAVLFEAQALGAGQTRYSQGIIHGGTKYALTGKLTGSSEAVADMPASWRAALKGDGDIDLRRVTLLSENQFLWSTGKLTSDVAGFFASKLMKSRTANVEGDARPQVLRDRHFKGQVYRLDEPVLDVSSLVAALAEPYRDTIFKLPDDSHYRITPHDDEWCVALAGPGDRHDFAARRIVFTAGSGNAALLKQIGRHKPAMQLRPLHMVMVRSTKECLLPGHLYAHCLGASATPRITITTHLDRGGNTVWYLGGHLAEKGMARSPDAQIDAARMELGALFPWLDLGTMQWRTMMIDRAEVEMPDISRPDNMYLEEEGGVITAWPTKLALAPRLADSIISAIKEGGVYPTGQTMLPQLAHPGYAPLPWLEDEPWT